VTRSGVLLGTIAFMSFEQLQGRQADAQSDQFSFCASLYEALHGVGPYPGHDRVSLLTAMLADTRRPVPAGLAVPRRLSRALWRGLSKEPSRRWPSMHALIVELEALTRARRSRAVVASLGLSLGLGLVAATSFSREPADPCPDIATALEGTWDADAQQRVEQAFAVYEPAGDTALATRLVERLDDYATAWATMTRDSCEATFVTRRQSEAQLEHRTRCLERRRNRLVATISALTVAEDAQALTQAVVLPFRLPALDPCGEAALAGVDAAPVDPGDERHVALRRAIDEASTIREAGRMDEAVALAEAALADARMLADPGLLAEALECLGRVQADSGSMVAAQTTLEEAIVVANDAKDDPTAARAWLSLLFVTTMRGNHAETQHHALAARAAVERDDDDVLRAWLFNSLGVLAAEQSRYELARDRFEQALRLKQTALGAEHVDVGIAWQNLGTLLSDAGEPRDAVDALTQARTIFAATVGESHPWNAYVLTNSCQAEHDLGHLDAAIVLCERALAHFDTYNSAPLESRTRLFLADLLWSAGRAADAIAMARRGIELGDTGDPNRSAVIEQWTQWIASEERKQENRP
jgi:eukaryotic-like serine/threonine-protein kinase